MPPSVSIIGLGNWGSSLARALTDAQVPLHEVVVRGRLSARKTTLPLTNLDRARLEPLMKARKHRPLLLIDIAVPRDIDPSVNFLDNVYLYNIDDLQAIAGDYLRQRREEIARCEAIIAEKAGAMMPSASSAHVGAGAPLSGMGKANA